MDRTTPVLEENVQDESRNRTLKDYWDEVLRAEEHRLGYPGIDGPKTTTHIKYKN